jgi:hypothetical protein
MRLAPLLGLGLLTSPAVADAPAAARKGTFLPFTDAPTSASGVRTFGDYDSARRSTIVRTGVQADLSDRIQIAAGVTFEDAELDPAVSVQLGLLDEDKHGIDLQVTGGWTHAGFNEVPAAFAVLASGATIGATYLTSMARFELGTEQSERAGIVGAAAVRSISDHTFVGFDSQLQLDLERGAMEPAGEAAWDLVIGPIASYAMGTVVVTASAGFAAQEARDGDSADVGAYGGFGFGGLF